ncbi:antirestriction protein ArdC [Dysgonomonas sp. PFB1-18]|uniref:ArdC family protein n=1 Tax=unclassified Dysgonomonas TaxID=2630389 RepID=UPI0024754250|nr:MULTISPECIES: zincin-like metallopeptidase domain-containing protein [unclassified Dysgonomonas]MDH6310895.1 antirestriction protein ArdC [Dysgonomonas sp. PF1-14]MDH6341036.1 antirestriction protein ArdC [Dysgonomonas sp. PF1-16]MDH6382719.1 antirestriction protein ArdC [Dysgonomonas sp. PFB1-18]MDH6400018.1 antirestriction protein ArdC [Dysgonomonas sp. PF1-23]
MKINSKRLKKTAEKFTALMISRIMEVDKDWTKPWLEVKRKDFLPRNITGRLYSGGNTLMLLIYCMYHDYSSPVFLTFLQAKNMGISVKKGAVSFPVYHIPYMYYNPQTQEKISIEKFQLLDEAEQKQYYLIPTPKCYDVFNLDQTDYSEKYPEEWAELLSHHLIAPSVSGVGKYSNSLLDELLEYQNWVCPVEQQFSNRAYYSPAQDRIVLPYKYQFTTGESFYGTALHEMTHSTGHKDRLNRLKAGSVKGSDNYAREELVAELSAALMGYYLGIETYIREDHTSYLKYWLGALQQDAGFLMEVLSDVVQAVKFICNRLNFNPFEQEQAETKVLPKENKKQKLFAFDELMVID